MSRRKNNRKAKNVILSLMLIVAIGVTAAFAFLTASETSENLFTVGNVKIDLTEPGWDAANPDGILENIVSGQKIVKDPTITNTGKNNAYVYVMVEVPKADGIIIDDAIVNDYQLFNYTVNESWELLNSKIDEDDINNYYLYAYNTALTPSSSSILFNEVVFANIASDFQPDEALNIKVTGYAIQSDYYNGEATDAASAWNLYATQNGWKFPTNPANSTGSGDTTNVDPVQVFSLMKGMPIYSYRLTLYLPVLQFRLTVI